MRKIRKQLYIGQEHQVKLRRLAARWGCPEAEVVRRAIEGLPEGDDAAIERLRAAGLLVEPPEVELRGGQSAQEVERWFEEEWPKIQTEPLGLSQAVWEDREGR